MLQKYFAGNLVPWQEKAWKAEDGIFYLVADVDATMKVKDDWIVALQREYVAVFENKDETISVERAVSQCLREDFNEARKQIVALEAVVKAKKSKSAVVEKLKEQIAVLTADRSDAWCLVFNLWPGDKEPSDLDLCGVINELSERYKKQIAALITEMQSREDYIDGCLV